LIARDNYPALKYTAKGVVFREAAERMDYMIFLSEYQLANGYLKAEPKKRDTEFIKKISFLL